MFAQQAHAATSWSILSQCTALAMLAFQILRLLKESQGNILDDEQLINTLNHSKATSSVIGVGSWLATRKCNQSVYSIFNQLFIS
jgi:hypothetical protein